jgi:hypothetical protein
MVREKRGKVNYEIETLNQSATMGQLGKMGQQGNS